MSTFVGYKSVGFVSNHLPLQLRYIRPRGGYLVVTCVGNTIHTYTGENFRLLTVGRPLDDEILCMAADAYHVYTGVGKKIYAWRRGTEIEAVYEGHVANLIGLMPFGPH
ncbi:unnamed protein product, partial [Notodromas monacha]